VASAAPGDGKTTIARHLAAAAARMGSRDPADNYELDLRLAQREQQVIGLEHRPARLASARS